MASDAKTRPLECGGTAVDRISNLPTSLIELILECLPTHDAARTCILSKTWRYIWRMHPQVNLDDKFISQLVSQKFSDLDEQTRIKNVTRTVSNILLDHRGPILDFHLFIHPDLPIHQSLDMNIWFIIISKKGVRKLDLLNGPVTWKLPFHFFSCSQLTHLCLTNCILNPPRGFGGFCNLISADLICVIFNADMTFGTKLKELDMKICTGIEHLGPQFKWDNNLTELSIVDCETIDWQWFEFTRKLKCLRLMMDEVLGTDKKMINLDKLVGNMPRIESLHLHGFFFKILEPDAGILKRLTRPMEKLKFLYLYSIDLHDLVHIQSVLCLIRSSPNLQLLDVNLEDEVQSTDGKDLLDLTALSNQMILDRLETLSIYYMAGLHAEFQFLKCLLASSPSLRRIKFKTDSIVDDPADELRISQEVMQIPRASKDAQILCHGSKYWSK